MGDEHVWIDDTRDVDWDELSELYRIAPLGVKPPDALRTVFGNSMFTSFATAGGALVAAGRAMADGLDCAYIADVAVHPDAPGPWARAGMVRRLVDRASRPPQDHPLRQPGHRAVLRRHRVPADEHRDGGLARPGGGDRVGDPAGPGMSERVFERANQHCGERVFERRAIRSSWIEPPSERWCTSEPLDRRRPPGPDRHDGRRDRRQQRHRARHGAGARRRRRPRRAGGARPGSRRGRRGDHRRIDGGPPARPRRPRRRSGPSPPRGRATSTS